MFFFLHLFNMLNHMITRMPLSQTFYGIDFMWIIGFEMLCETHLKWSRLFCIFCWLLVMLAIYYMGFMCSVEFRLIPLVIGEVNFIAWANGYIMLFCDVGYLLVYGKVRAWKSVWVSGTVYMHVVFSCSHVNSLFISSCQHKSNTSVVSHTYYVQIIFKRHISSIRKTGFFQFTFPLAQALILPLYC